MSAPQGEISHVSDTALMAAACRAMETAREDGFVRDPFAARLAGDRGMAIARALPSPEMMSFGIGVRSRFLDELLLETISNHPVAAVVSLGCGLDSRPWRLELPPQLRWVEIDFPEMLDYKASLMKGETPRCRLERRTVDLNQPSQRREIYAAAADGPALMITEGLLMYLPGATVEALAAETARTGIHYWLSDITSPAFAEMVRMGEFKSIRNVQADDHLDGVQILDALRRHGWQTGARRSYITDMAFAEARIRRMIEANPRPAGAPAPGVPPGDPTGVHRFDRGSPGH